MPSEPGPSASEQLVLGPDDSDFVDSEVDAKEEKEQAEVDGGLELASDGLTTHETKTEVRCELPSLPPAVLSLSWVLHCWNPS